MTLSLIIQCLTSEEMVDQKRKRTFHNYDEKFVKSHKYSEQKSFHMDIHAPPTSDEVTSKGPQEVNAQHQPQLELEIK